MGPGDVATWVGVVITLAISLLTHVQSRRQARIAEESNIASQEQVEAAQRRAVAVEEGLAEALRLLAQRGLTPDLPRFTRGRSSGADEVRWELAPRGKHSYLLRNVGTVTATGVHVDRSRATPIVRNMPEQATIRPGESVQFLMAPSLGNPLPGEVWVDWDGQSEATSVPLPN